ncbi:MAG: hypothetical protein U1F11_04765 [Steroidobacteraceae bacterium]
MARRYKAQPARMLGLKLPIPPRERLDPDMRKYFGICEEKIGFLPERARRLQLEQAKLRLFIGMYNDLMLGDSKLSMLSSAR